MKIMNNFFKNIIVTFFILGVCGQVYSDNSNFSLLSWNILGLEVTDSDLFFPSTSRYKTQDERLVDIISVIESYDADIVCLQEVSKETIAKLKPLEHTYAIVSWTAKGKHGGVALLAKKKIFSMVSSLSQQLRDDKQKIAGACSGACLKFIDDPAELVACSAHISRRNERDLQSYKSGMAQLQDIVTAISTLSSGNKNMPVVVAGDFNTLYEEVATDYLQFMQSFLGKLFNFFEHHSFTASEFNGKMSSIDHVMFNNLQLIRGQSFVAGNLKVPQVPALQEKVYLVQMSDKQYSIVSSVLPTQHYCKTYEMVLVDPVLKQDLISPLNCKVLQNPSDHLPVYATFKKPLNLANQGEPQIKNHCSSTYKFPNGTKVGPAHYHVERAGVLLIVHTNVQSNDPFEKFGIMVGQDKHDGLWMVGQAGKIEKKDAATFITASRELAEETGGYFKMSANKIAALPYLYADKKQLFVYKSNYKSLVSHVDKAVKQAQHNPKLSHAYKEIDAVEVVSIKNFLELVKKIDQGKVEKHNYLVTTTTGKKIRLEHFYTQMFGYMHDHDRLKYATEMFKQICV